MHEVHDAADRVIGALGFYNDIFLLQVLHDTDDVIIYPPGLRIDGLYTINVTELNVFPIFASFFVEFSAGQLYSL